MAIAKLDNGPITGKESLTGILDRAATLIGSVNPSGDAPRRLVALVEIILVVMLAVLVAKMVLGLITPLALPSGDRLASVPQTPTQSASGPAQNPFPDTPVAISEASNADVVAETDLNLTLMGTWSEGGGAGSAVIKTPDGEQSRFDVGDELVNGVSLDEVYGDHVVIDRRGARESLRFETKLKSSRNKSNRPRRLREQSTENNAQLGLANIVRAAPGRNAEGGTTIELYSSRNGAAFRRLGLRNGDVLHSVNGAPAPEDAAQLATMFAQLQRAASATIEVNRDGEIIPITIRSENLSGE